MTDYNFPTSDEKTLYVDMDCRTYTFDELFEKIKEHFGPERQINEFNIKSERIKITGCSCHPEYSDYEVYLIVELRDRKEEDVVSFTLATMTEIPA